MSELTLGKVYRTTFWKVGADNKPKVITAFTYNQYPSDELILQDMQDVCKDYGIGNIKLIKSSVKLLYTAG